MLKHYFLTILLLAFSVSVLAQENVITHTVKSGETISSICKEYGLTKDELVKFNPTVKNYVYSGQTIKIPVKATAQSITENSDNSLKEEIRTEKKDQTNKSEQITKVDSEPKFNNNQQVSYNNYERVQFTGGCRLGIYTKPDNLDAHFLALSIDVYDIGARLNITKNLFVQGTFGMAIDYSRTWDSSSSGTGDYKVKSEFKNTDFNSTFGIPILLGVKIGPVSLRGGFFGRYAWIGSQNSFNKITSKEFNNTERNYFSYKDIEKDNETFDRFTYGLSFDLTNSFNSGRNRGIGLRIITSEHSKKPYYLISYVAFLNQ